MPLQLYNTLTRKKELFKPLHPPMVGLYTCGPTVYSYAHIGNLRAYVFEDVLKRVLLFNKFKVKHVMNITDVGHLTSDADEGEDKMMKGLRREGLPITLEGMKILAQKYTKAFQDDLKKLNILPPTKMPKASKHIKEDLVFIRNLERKNFTYKTADGLYFDTSKLSDYGKLLGSRPEPEEKYARLKPHGEKKHPRDFALWKFNTKLGWSSPWNKGFPGWHLECSVMATKYLGKQFDIHCGGKEHIPIHHTNEIAQSEAALGRKPWVKYWLHHEWLVLKDGDKEGEKEGHKMAKSGENFITLSTLEQRGFHPLVLRYFCLGTHYRVPLAFSGEALEGAKHAHRKLVEKVLELRKAKKEKQQKGLPQKYLQLFTQEVNDDLNTPRALATMWEMLRDEKLAGKEKYQLLLKFDEVLGLNLKKVKEEKVPLEIRKIAEERLQARKQKDWKKADGLRQKIQEKGYVIGDTAEGYEIRKR